MVASWLIEPESSARKKRRTSAWFWDAEVGLDCTHPDLNDRRSEGWEEVAADLGPDRTYRVREHVGYRVAVEERVR
jgi:hypothetical protein